MWPHTHSEDAVPARAHLLRDCSESGSGGAVLSPVRLLAKPRIVAHQSPLSTRILEWDPRSRATRQAPPRPSAEGLSDARPHPPRGEACKDGDRLKARITCESGEPCNTLGHWKPLQIRGELHLYDAGHALQHHPGQRRPLLTRLPRLSGGGPAPAPRADAAYRRSLPGPGRGGAGRLHGEVSCRAPIGSGRVTCAPRGGRRGAGGDGAARPASES